MIDEITAEEAKSILETMHYELSNQLGSDWCRNKYKAIDKAIKALEPKPMEKFDDVKTHIQRLAGDYKCWDNRLTWEEALELNRMLEAQQYTDEEIDKAQAVEQAYVDKMVELAVEAVKRPKGKWIKCKSRFGTEYFKCSECGRKLNWIDSDDNYCNSCGSDNSESTKELYKEKLAEISGGGEDEISD